MHKTLYRSYRPQTFEGLIGQDIITSNLQSAIRENKIAHAYLFAGASGTGKTTLAKIFSKAVNCSSENKPCNTCEVCTLINNEQTIDVIEIDAASNSGVEQIRNLIESIQYPPIVCKYKVYIIDEVHMLSTAAFNALLKTLEEPPTNSLFILATTEEHKIPETILTRCQRYNFSTIATKEITDLLADVLNKENKKFKSNALELIAEMSNGSVRKALSTTEQCMHLEDTLTVDVVNKAYGLLLTSEVINIVKAIYNSDKTTLTNMMVMVNEKGTNYQRLLEEVLMLFKEILIKDLNTEKYGTKFLTEENKNQLDISDDFVYKAITIIKDSMGIIKFSSNPKLSFEITLLELARINEESFKEENIKPLFQEEFKVPKIPSIKEIIETKVEETIIEEVAKPVIEKVTKVQEVNASVTNSSSKEDILKEMALEKELLISEVLLESQQLKEEVDVIKPESVLNILLGANKIQRESLVGKWNLLESQPRDQENSKWISMLTNSKIVASSNDAVIVLFDFEPSANILNKNNKEQGLLKLLKDVFGREFLFLGTWKEDWEQQVKAYKKLKEENNLPKVQPINVPKFLVKTQVDKTEIQEIQDLFGDLVEIE